MMLEAKSMEELEEFPNPTGLDPLIKTMLLQGTPISLENYLTVNGRDWEEMEPESQATIPRVLFDPRLKELKPSEKHYAMLLKLLAKPKFLNHTVDEMRDELDHW